MLLMGRLSRSAGLGDRFTNDRRADKFRAIQVIFESSLLHSRGEEGGQLSTQVGLRCGLASLRKACSSKTIFPPFTIL